MLLRIAIILPMLYFLTIVRSSFLPHFSILGYVPDLVFILIVFFIFLIPSSGFIFAFWGGILLDVSSQHFLGFHVLILLGAIFFLKSVLKKYVQVSFG